MTLNARRDPPVAAATDEEEPDSWTPVEIHEDDEDGLIDRSKRQWSSDETGSIWTGTGMVEPKIPPGLYKCSYNDKVGPLLKRLIISNDDLIRLPDTAADEIIEEIEKFHTLKTEFQKRGFLHKRGILTYGEPGTGKTSTIKILINSIIEDGGVAIYPDSSDAQVTSECLQMFRQIEPERPLLLILEDFETLVERSHEENTWLAILDGEAQVDNVVFLATTNYIEKLDKRFVDRPSRFDTIKPVPALTANARAIFFSIKEASLTNEEIDHWTSLSEGFSIAHLKEMIICVKCYGKTVDEAVEKLRLMKAKSFTNDEFNETSVGFESGTALPEKINWKKVSKFVKEYRKEEEKITKVPLS